MITNHDALILDRHGAITVGATLKEALYKLEKVEYAAVVTLTARQLGHVQNLTPEQVAKLQTITSYGHRVTDGSCTDCGTCGDK